MGSHILSFSSSASSSTCLSEERWAVAQGSVEHAIRAELNGPSVVVQPQLHEGSNDLFGGRICHVWIGSSAPRATRNHALASSARVVDEKVTMFGVIRVKGKRLIKPLLQFLERHCSTSSDRSRTGVAFAHVCWQLAKSTLPIRPPLP
jgi:hypothetical protein